MSDLSIARRVGIKMRRAKGPLAACLLIYGWTWRYNWWDGIMVALSFYVVLAWLGRQQKARIGPDVSHGSARLATNTDLAKTGNIAAAFAPDRYILGLSCSVEAVKGRETPSLPASSRGKQYRPVITTRTKFQGSGNKVDDGHIVTIAGAGSGKGIAVVKPNLMAYDGSVVVLDPKGENFLSTVEARVALGQRICLVDPFNVAPDKMRLHYQARFNPLETLEAHYRSGRHFEVFDEAASIAEMIVFSTDNESQPHWNDKAKAFLKAAIMFVTYAKGYQDRLKTPLTLITVKNCILQWFQTAEMIEKFAERCRTIPELMGVAGDVTMIEAKERSSVLSTLLRHTEFLNSPNVQESLSATDFRLSDLKTEKLSVYLVLPATRLKAYSRLARLWLGTLLQVMMADALPPPRRVLFMLDEVAQLGSMDALEQAVSLGRGYGIDIWMLFQDIHQMKDAYGDRWETFLANAKVQQFFGVQDVTTAEYVSKKLGQTTIETQSYSDSFSTNTGSNSGSSNSGNSVSNSSGTSSGRSRSQSSSTQQAGRLLMQPDEVMRIPENQLLIFFAAQYPVLAEKCSVLQPEVMQALLTVRPIDLPRSRKMIEDQSAQRLEYPLHSFAGSGLSEEQAAVERE